MPGCVDMHWHASDGVFEGIFHYRGVEARERWAAQAMEGAGNG